MATTVASAQTTGAARRTLLRGACSATGPLLFVSIQLHLRVENWHLFIRNAVSQGYVPPPGAEFHWISSQFIPDLCVYLGVAAAAWILVRLGFRYLWVLPAALFTLVPLVTAYHTPGLIGHAWYIFGLLTRRPWYGTTRVAAGVDLTLALIPAGAWLGSVERRTRRDWRLADLLSLAVVIAAEAIVVRTSHVVTGQMAVSAVVCSVGAFALLASSSRPWWPWAAILVAAFVSGWMGAMFNDVRYGSLSLGSVASDLRSETLPALPFLLSALVLSTWEPLSAAMRRSEESPVALLVAVNVLNVADALFTQFAVGAGQATELNPLVRSIGVPAKVVGVGLLSWLLYRKRPALLLIPIAVLLVVLAYHVSGFVIDA